MAEVEPSSSDDINEDEGTRHRRERRQLQSTILQLKKSVNKNDKARKKKVDNDIKILEEQFAKRWEHFRENPATEEPETTPAVTEDSNATSASNENQEVPVENNEEKKHVSRKARRLANKEKRQAEIVASLPAIDYDNQPDAIRSRNESKEIDDQLFQRGLQLRPVPSDGNCLFASIVDQAKDFKIEQLRKMVAEYLRKHRDDYKSFIDVDFETYCDKIEKENVWGGQIELEVCSRILEQSIEVIQGNNNQPIKIYYPMSKPPIVITYHRYLYVNGEHYNSTMIKTENDDE